MKYPYCSYLEDILSAEEFVERYDEVVDNTLIDNIRSNPNDIFRDGRFHYSIHYSSGIGFAERYNESIDHTTNTSRQRYDDAVSEIAHSLPSIKESKQLTLF